MFARLLLLSLLAAAGSAAPLVDTECTPPLDSHTCCGSMALQDFVDDRPAGHGMPAAASESVQEAPMAEEPVRTAPEDCLGNPGTS
eukprot:CAMPEP_0170314374 /NCGR_PEP_ID=MMETSP0116_2-20130129/57764_1 /TAXON_ID=400756 /ORGANISM="Durinskia baltica, Strain CSIRO CS-38" /LENGTH=85 /DNA_ID=CAMNT_0010566831 /DNA_START=68 /DNA_END=322 /DNA_ORIENTATION=-